jgi:hypothetical protein
MGTSGPALDLADSWVMQEGRMSCERSLRGRGDGPAPAGRPMSDHYC